jgi:uncharacterized protein YjbJ (UPF0337 family)
MQQHWGKLTDDDINEIQGNREKLEGKLQERYGMAQQDAREQIDEWADRMKAQIS